MTTSDSRKGTSLSRKLLLLGAMPAVIMFIVLMFFFTSARLDDARLDLAQSSQLLADSLAPALEYSVVSGNTQALDQVIRQSLMRSNAEWIRVTDLQDDELGFVSNQPVDLRKHKSHFDIYAAEILQEPLELGTDTDVSWFAPGLGFSGGALRVGSVEVGVDPKVLAARQQDILWSSFAIGMAMLLFTIIIVNIFLNQILKPVQNLASRVSRLIDGDYQQQPVTAKASSREIAELQKQLNELASHLDQLKTTQEQMLASSELARQKAEQASQAKSEFLATMSHELRTPLNGVLGMVDLIQAEPLTSRQRDYLCTARQSTEDLLTVISDILDYSRMESGTLTLEHQQFDLHALLSNCAASYRYEAGQRGLALDLTFLGEWPDQPLVIGDAPRIRQIVAGLIGNSLKFTLDGFINIRTGWLPLESHCVLFSCSVQDSGTGISSNQIGAVFNSFEQLDTGSTRAHDGTGMGLALVQRLVELMGGHIQVESDFGGGSSFRFEIPLELAEPAPSQEPRTRPDPASGDGRRARALVVEDNIVNQKVTRALLNKLGFETDVVTNGQEAVDQVKNYHDGYDVILMDCQMPVMDGYEATLMLREWEKGNGQAGVPIIALTADVSKETEYHCRNCGMNDYIPKPIRQESLRRALSQWIPV